MEYQEMANYKNDATYERNVILADIEVIVCSNCNYILSEKNYIDCGLYVCPHCKLYVDGDLENL